MGDADDSLRADLLANSQMSQTDLVGGLLPGEGEFLVILIDALDGNDKITIGPTVQKSVWIDAGAGDDIVEIRGGNAILVDQAETAASQGNATTRGRNDTPAQAFTLQGAPSINEDITFTGLTIDHPSDVDWFRFGVQNTDATLDVATASLIDQLTVSIYSEELLTDPDVAPLLMMTGAQSVSLSLASLVAETTYLIEIRTRLTPTIYDIQFNFDGDSQTLGEVVELALRSDAVRRDVILGGPGNDILQGGAGEDFIFGGPGNEVPDFVAPRYNTGLHRYEFTSLVWDIANGRFMPDANDPTRYQQHFLFFQASDVEYTQITTRGGNDVVHADPESKFLPIIDLLSDSPTLDGTVDASLFEEWGIDLIDPGPYDLDDSFALTGATAGEMLSDLQGIGDFTGDGFEDFLVSGADQSYVMFRPMALDDVHVIEEVSEIVIDHSALGVPTRRFGDLNGDSLADLAFVRTEGGDTLVGNFYLDALFGEGGADLFLAERIEVRDLEVIDRIIDPLLTQLSTVVVPQPLDPVIEIPDPALQFALLTALGRNTNISSPQLHASELGSLVTVDATDVVEVASGTPIHRYSFDGGGGNGAVIVDSVGGANGVLRGADNSVLNGAGQAVLGGGSSQSAGYIDLPNGIISSLTDASFEAWVTWTDNGNWTRIFDFGSSNFGEIAGPGGTFNGDSTNYAFLTTGTGVAGPVDESTFVALAKLSHWLNCRNWMS